METLEQVTIEKLQNRIKSHAPNAEAAYGRLIQEGRIAKDFIANVGTNNDQRNQHVSFSANGSVKMTVTGSEFRMHRNAVNQLGTKMGIPAKYIDGLAVGADWQKALCAQILNEHSGYTYRSRVLVRAVGDEVRGVLSDSYRRLNSPELVEMFVKSGYGQGAVLADGLMTDTKIYIEMLMPQPLVFDTPKNGTAVMAYGARLSSSDYGDGALELRTFTMQGVCLNGMVRESVMRTVHLGAKLPDNIQLSERTYRHDTQLQGSLIKDLNKAIFDPKKIKSEMELIQDASWMDVDLEKEIKLLPKIGLSKDEADRVGRVLIGGKEENGVQGEPTLWKLVNGVTAVGRDSKADRAREIQEIAGGLMNRARDFRK